MSSRNRFLRLVAVFAVAHFLLALGALLASFSLGIARFDSTSVVEPSLVERISVGLADALFQPAVAILSIRGPGSHSSVFQWVAIACNSVLWGFALAAVVWRLTLRSTRTPPGGLRPRRGAG
jgi:hypothetical protein